MKTIQPDFSVAFAAQAQLGEGALWDERTRTLFWVDILGRRVNRLDPVSNKNLSVALPSLIGTVVSTEGDDVLVAIQEGICRVDFASGKHSRVLTPMGHDPARLRFNDGKCDPAGRFWAGTMSLSSEPAAGALYSFEAASVIHQRLDSVSISNGIAWSHDASTMYYIDTPQSAVDQFDYNLETGELGNRRTVIRFPVDLGYPDGMTIDREGHLWVAMWDGGGVIRCDPQSGRLLEKYLLPAARITSCAWGGEKLDTLFATSARVDLTPEQLAQQPMAGSIFAFQPGALGTPAFRFRG